MPTRSSPPQGPERSTSLRGEAVGRELGPQDTAASGRQETHGGDGRAGNRGRGSGQRAPWPRGLTWGGGLVDEAVPVPLGHHGVAHGEQGQELLDAGCCGLQTEPRSVAVRMPLADLLLRVQGTLLLPPEQRSGAPLTFQAPFHSHLLTIRPISCGSQPPTAGTQQGVWCELSP